jgi:hypothetical protein
MSITHSMTMTMMMMMLTRIFLQGYAAATTSGVGGLLLLSKRGFASGSSPKTTTKDDHHHTDDDEDNKDKGKGKDKGKKGEDWLAFRNVVQDTKLAHVATSQLKNRESHRHLHRHVYPLKDTSGRRKSEPSKPASSPTRKDDEDITSIEEKKTPWNPIKRISRAQMDHLRFLHRQVTHTHTHTYASTLTRLLNSNHKIETDS